MENLSLRETIKKNLLTDLNKLSVHSMSANKKEISVRCPNCGDSKKHANSSHLYINIDTTSDKFLQYYCQRCKFKGYINSDFLKALKLGVNQSLIIDIDKDSKNNRRKNRGKYKRKLNKKTFKYPKYENTRLNQIKLKYINSRLDTKLSFKDLKRYKIILNLYDVLNLNKIDTLTCKEQMGDTLDSNFIGFVSYDNNYITMRNLSKKVLPDCRYYNYNIFEDYDNTKKFYIIPNKLNFLSERITVILTEGIFDLLSVYFNFEKTDRTNKIYAAVCGIGYNAVLQEIIRMGFLDIELKIYGDNDQDTKLYKSIKKEFYPFVTRVELYTNSLSKDFGDIRKGIKIKKAIL